ncbi:MAG TPA: UDP-galactopyranose mutase [Sulfuricurvum sp.]|nr:UDP-galactopyranose mutase [Sulfuricurvum sp.]
MKTFDTIVVGAGFAGSVIAHRLATEQNKKVLIIEKREHIGGNCYDYVDDNGVNIHKYGPHLFHTDNEEVYAFLKSLGELENYQHHVEAFIDGQNVPIPFNLNTIEKLFPPSLVKAFEEKLLEHYDYNQKVPILELREKDDDKLKALADYIYEKVFVNYTAKQWGMKPEEIDAAVTARVPVLIGKDNRYFHDRYQVVPKKGYTRLFETMLGHENIKLLLQTGFDEVCAIEENKVMLFGQPFAGKVIYTGPIDELFGYEYGALEYRSIDLQFETVEKAYFQHLPVVNYPNDYDYTRITEFKHIHPVNTEKTTILKEYPQAYAAGKNVPYYPVFTEENRQRYEQYSRRAALVENMVLVGRLAEFKYYDMDDVIERALSVYRNECGV